MLKHITIRNFKSLKDVSVDLGPFTVLIGKNGAGKSSFLQALQMLSWLVKRRSINDVLDEHDLTYNELVHLRAANSRMHWEAEYAVTDPQTGELVDVHMEIGLAKRRHVYVASELAHRKSTSFVEAVLRKDFCVGRDGRNMLAQEGTKSLVYTNMSLPHSILLDVAEKRKRFPILGSLAHEVSGFMHYEIWGPEPLRRSSSGSAGLLAERGQNLPSVLRTLRSTAPDAFRALVSELQGAYPWLDSIEFRSLGAQEFGLSFLEIAAGDKRKRRLRYSASQVSDGFLRLLALTALKYQPELVTLLGYEEPENGMHPGMLIESVKRLRDIAERGVQVIVTTHSPFLLQYLFSNDAGGDPLRELKLVWRGKDGNTRIGVPKKDILHKARAGGVGIGELWAMLTDESEMAEPPKSE